MLRRLRAATPTPVEEALRPLPRSDAFEVAGYDDVVPIGFGGASTVYRARQVDFDRLVAVKVLTRADESVLRRFDREKRILGRLSGYPAIAQVFDAGVTGGGVPYLVMQYHPGGSLADLLRRGRPQPVDRVLPIGVKLAATLAAAHALGVLHRDIKPGNVMLDVMQEPVLADFGISGWATEGHEHTAALTYQYAAPEVVNQPTAASTASDQYSLALTLWALLAGRNPWEDMAGRRLTELPATVPDEVAGALRRALAADPGQRYQSCMHLARALRAAQDALGLPATAAPGVDLDEPTRTDAQHEPTGSDEPGEAVPAEAVLGETPTAAADHRSSEPSPAAHAPSSAPQQQAPDRVDVRPRQIEEDEPTAQADEPTAQADEPTAQADEPTAYEPVHPAAVRDAEVRPATAQAPGLRPATAQAPAVQPATVHAHRFQPAAAHPAEGQPPAATVAGAAPATGQPDGPPQSSDPAPVVHDSVVAVAHDDDVHQAATVQWSGASEPQVRSPYPVPPPAARTHEQTEQATSGSPAPSRPGEDGAPVPVGSLRPTPGFPHVPPAPAGAGLDAGTAAATGGAAGSVVDAPVADNGTGEGREGRRSARAPLAMVVAVALAAGAAIAVFRDGPAGQQPIAPSEPAAVALPLAAPTGVAAAVNGDQVVVTWDDTNGGRLPYFVYVSGSGQAAVTTQPGERSVSFPALPGGVGMCFRVGVLDASQAATSDEVCTDPAV